MSFELSRKRERLIARVLRPLGRGPLTHAQAERAAQLLGLHWTSVYRLRKRFLASRELTSSLIPQPHGRRQGHRRLPSEEVVGDVLRDWLPRQLPLAHPTLDLHTEIRKRCLNMAIPAPSRNTVARRLEALRQEQAAALEFDPSAQTAPGSFEAKRVLDVVQIDHTQADVFVVDRFSRRNMGRPWLSLAIDVASRCVVGFLLAMERPNAASVALLVSRIVLDKQPWLTHLDLQLSWPMHGIPRMLHLDNAAEFHSRALRLGCAEYGIELSYRPVGRPHFGGHIERLNRTLMQRLRGLPGATGNSTVGRKLRKPEATASMTLHELERWLALEVGERYHLSGHRGLHGATPAGAWAALEQSAPPRLLSPGPDAALRLLTHFMPLALRTVQGDGVTVFYIRYWHPVFAVWREDRRKVRIRYHPEDLSRVYVSADGKNYVEARYADLRRPAISLWEQRMAVRALRARGDPRISEPLVFKAIEQQRAIVDRARRETNRAKRSSGSARNPRASPWAAMANSAPSPVDYTKDLDAFPVEIW